MKEAAHTLLDVLGRRRRTWVTGVGVLALASTIAGVMAVPWIGGRIIDSIVQPAADDSQLIRWTLYLALAAVVSAVSRTSYRIIFAWWSAASVQDLRDRMLDYLQRAEIRLFDHERTGLLSSLFSNDAALVGRIYYPVGSDFLRSMFQLLAILVIVLTEFNAIGWSLVPLIPLYLAFPLLFSRKIREASQSLQEARAEALSGVQETLEGMREIKALGREKWSSRRLGRHFGAVVGARVRAEKLRSVFEIEFALYWVLLGFMYWWGGRRVLAGQMSVGELVAFLGYVGYVRGPVSRLVSINTDLQESLAAARRIFRIFTEPLEDTGGTRKFPSTSETPTIEFEHVTFWYERGAKPALADLSFRVEPGTLVGLVGPSGAGKSTLVKLLIRFYDPQQGRIVLGGSELQDYDLDSLRSGFGVVLQEPFLFSGTIRENIALGDPGAKHSEILEAARIANASAFIEALPEGYDSQIGEKGSRLSGGQKQRIAIARVALTNPRILILDEATSALDARSDQLVRDALQRLMGGRTSVAIAHRLSTVLNADELLLLDEGRLVAKGCHEDLISRSKLYERLYSLQFAEETESSTAAPKLASGA